MNMKKNNMITYQKKKIMKLYLMTSPPLSSIVGVVGVFFL